MSEIHEEIFFSNSGLNLDDDTRFISSGDSKYRLNVVPTDNGSTFTLTNIKGTKKYSHSFTHETPTYDAAVYSCIGDCYDVSRNAVYLFMYSTLSNHSILRFNYDDQSWNKIVFDSLYLGFDNDYPITDAFMIDDYLFYNPRTSSPRMVNVKWCTNYWDYDILDDPATYDIGDKFSYKGKIFESIEDGLSGADAVTDITTGTFASVSWTGERYLVQNNEYFYNYPYQPIIAPVCIYSSDTDKNYNNLKGRVFQFAYRYVYGDGRTSLYSPYSIIQGQSTGESYDGDENNSVLDDNKLTIDVRYLYDFGWNFEIYIDYVDVVFRESDSAGWGDWKLAGQLDWVDVINDNDFVFYNDKNFLTVDDIAVATPNYTLPVTARSQWSLDGKRVAYGGNVDGYNVTVPKVTLTEVFDEIVVNQSGTLNATYTVTETVVPVDYDGDRINDWNEYYYAVAIPGTSTAGYSVTVTVNGESAFLIVDGGWSLEQYRNAIRDLMIINFGNTQTTATGVELFTSKNKSVVTVKVYSSPSSLYTKRFGFKSGASHKFCLFYYDELMRRSPAVDSDDLSIYLPFVTEQSSLTAGYIYKQSVSFEINHRPPSWAKYWKIGYAGNTTISDFWQYTITSITATPTITTHAGMTEINIDSLQKHKVATPSGTASYSFPNSTIDLYDYQEGDRIRFITASDGSAPTPAPLSVYYDYEIKAYDGNGTNEFIYIDTLPSLIITAASVVEIYRPKKEETETIYYETDKLFTLYTDSGVLYHKGEGQDQTSAQAAKVIITRGDIYYISRLFSVPINAASAELYSAESYSYSDFADTEVWGQGKVGVISDIGQTDQNSIVFSNQFFDTEGINGLSEFDGLDRIKLSSLYGDIKAMRQVGDTLRVYMERNTASVYVNKAQWQDSNGVSQIVLSDNVLNTPNYSPYLYGTIFPESVKMVDRHVYFYDIYRGCFVRDSSNGMIPISGSKGEKEGNLKMDSWFSEKSADLIASGVENISVNTAWDENLGMVFVVFRDSADGRNSTTIGFHEGSNRWVGFYDIENTRYTEYVYNATHSKMKVGTNVDNFSATQTNTDYEIQGRVAGASGAGTIVTDAAIVLGIYDKIKLVISNNDSTEQLTATMSQLSISEVIAANTDATIEATATSAVSQALTLTTPASEDDQLYAFHIAVYVNDAIVSTIEWLGGGGDAMIGYIGEDVYMHDDDTVARCYLYENQRKSIVEVVGVEAPNVKKTYENMVIHSNKPWDVTKITIDSDSTYPYGMESKIPEARFVRREGAYYAEYLRNMFSNSSTANNLDLLRGDPLRGYVITHRLENDDTTEVNLFKVDIDSSLSRV